MSNSPPCRPSKWDTFRIRSLEIMALLAAYPAAEQGAKALWKTLMTLFGIG